MPLGFHRLNVKQQPPNPNINFIKPLEGPDYDTAHDFLCRVAAISLPVTRRNLISIMSLEEFPANKEFWGRNFNNGECIQLVLKSPSTGNWLPFRFVQMVFMHELAHCKEMNHGRNFWMVRNMYCEEIKELWRKGYVGDGMWGVGRDLYPGQVAELPPAETRMVGSICGGTYKGAPSRKRRAKNNSHLTNTENKQRRIQKKFGNGGVTLGNDEEARIALEKGKRTKGKPRVAGSIRGRDLRAAAVLARLGQAKSKQESGDEDMVDEYDFEETDDLEEVPEGPEARGANGERLLDFRGNRLVLQLCEDENSADDGNAKRELEELESTTEKVNDVSVKTPSEESSKPTSCMSKESIATSHSATSGDTKPFTNTLDPKQVFEMIANPSSYVPRASSWETPSLGLASIGPAATEKAPSSSIAPFAPVALSAAAGDDIPCISCPICSLNNDPGALTCLACSHVLHTDLIPDHWRCSSEACSRSLYVNASDSGICGLCGTARSRIQ